MPKKLAGVTWNGLDDFKDELRLLTSNLVDDANEIMQEHAIAARDDIAAAYPYREGGLRRGLTLVPARGLLIAGLELQQRAPHGHLYEDGTRRRQNSAGQNRGRMKATATFRPTAAAYLRAAKSQVSWRLYHYGATKVTEDPDDA